jgi:hypothetical protein
MSSTRGTDRHLVFAGVLIAALAGTPADARAESGQVLAEALFQDAKALMDAKDFAHACPKLAESYRLEAVTGTLLALAMCHEGEGKTASAWTEFLTVEAKAQKDGRADRQKLASKRAAALAPMLSKLTIRVEVNDADLEVKLDGLVLARAAWNSAVPVDPGEHIVEANAPAKQTWSATVQLGPSAARESVTVPALADLPRPVAASSAPAPRASAAPPPLTHADGSGRRRAGIILASAGVVGLVVGGIYGVRAINKSHDAKSSCTDGVCTDPGAIDLNAQAKTSALVSDVGIGVGLLALGVGTYLMFSSPSRPSQPERTVHVTPAVGRQWAGLTMHAAW